MRDFVRLFEDDDGWWSRLFGRRQEQPVAAPVSSPSFSLPSPGEFEDEDYIKIPGTHEGYPGAGALPTFHDNHRTPTYMSGQDPMWDEGRPYSDWGDLSVPPRRTRQQRLIRDASEDL
jgi:hypothetical protein